MMFVSQMFMFQGCRREWDEIETTNQIQRKDL